MEDKGAVVIVAVVVIVLLAFMGSCSSKDNYSKTLNGGLRKYYSGKEMTEDEYKAVERYNKWQSKQGTKTYSDWSK